MKNHAISALLTRILIFRAVSCQVRSMSTLISPCCVEAQYYVERSIVGALSTVQARPGFEASRHKHETYEQRHLQVVPVPAVQVASI